MEPLYIYATPTQVKQEIEHLESKLARADETRILTTCNCSSTTELPEPQLKVVYTLLLYMVLLA